MKQIPTLLCFLALLSTSLASDVSKFDSLNEELSALMKAQHYSEIGAKACALLIYKRIWDPNSENVKVTSCEKTSQGWEVSVWRSSDLAGSGCKVKLATSGYLMSAIYTPGE